MKRSAPKPATGKPKPKTCKTCREKYTPRTPMQVACGIPCALALLEKTKAAQKAKQQRQERAQDKVKKESMQPAKYWKAKAKKAMHLYVRLRDEGKPCASCDTILIRLGRAGGDYDAGHFRSVGSAKHLEFDERNIFGQCKHCNDFMKGNQLEYERRLRLLKGDAYVEELKADQSPRHYKVADFQAIESHYKTAVKQLKQERE